MWLCAVHQVWNPMEFYALPEWVQWLWVEYAACHMPPAPQLKHGGKSRMKQEQAQLERWVEWTAAARKRGEPVMPMREWIAAGCPGEVTDGRTE